MAKWSFSQSKRVYTNTETGEEVGPAKLRGLRDQLADAAKSLAREAAARLDGGELNPSGFVRAMGDIVARVVTASYTLARGGESAMATEDYAQVAEIVQTQDGHLDTWVNGGDATTDESDDPETRSIDEESAAQIDARAAMYADSGIAAYGEGQLAAYGIDLPVLPGDGQTLCGGACRCHLRFEDQDDGSTDVYWDTEMDSAVCDDCFHMSDEWNPLTIDGPVNEDAADQG